VLIELALGHELPKSPTNCQLTKRVDGGHIAILARRPCNADRRSASAMTLHSN